VRQLAEERGHGPQYDDVTTATSELLDDDRVHD
jgi:hypothetical protein